MKRFAPILALALLLFVGGPAWGATYYIRADGTAANKGAATSCAAAASAMSVATHNGESFSAGDTIYLCDDGGIYRSSHTTDDLEPPSSGSSGSPIIYAPAPGDVVYMYGSINDSVDTSGEWTNILGGDGNLWASAADTFEQEVGFALFGTQAQSNVGEKREHEGATETLTNGDMETDDPPSSWTASNSTLDGVADERTGGAGAQSIEITATDVYGQAYQNITTKVGYIYEMVFWIKVTAGDSGRVLVEDTTGWNDLLLITNITDATWTQYTAYFVASTTEARVRLQAVANTDVVYFDDVSVKESTESIVNDKQYYWDDYNDRIVVYSTSNPGTRWGNNIEIGKGEGTLIDVDTKNYLTFLGDDRWFLWYSNYSGVMRFEDCQEILVDKMNLGWFGGDVGVSGGDGFNIVSDCVNITVQNSYCEQAYDQCGGAQTYLDGEVNETATGIVFDNCRADRCGVGFVMAIHDADGDSLSGTIQNCTITNSGYGWSGTDNSNHGRGIGVKEKEGCTGGVDAIIQDNYIDTFAWGGIVVNNNGQIHIKRNFITNGTTDYTTDGFNAGIILHGGDALPDTTQEVHGEVENNIIVNNGGDGIAIRNNKPALPEYLKIINNTFANNCSAASRYEIRHASDNDTIVENNMVYAVGGACYYHYDVSTAGTTDYNLWYRSSGAVWQDGVATYTALAAWQAASSQDANSITADPNPTSDFWPLNPALWTAGTDVSITTDYYGIKRRSTPTIGAIEMYKVRLDLRRGED